MFQVYNMKKKDVLKRFSGLKNKKHFLKRFEVYEIKKTRLMTFLKPFSSLQNEKSRF